MSDNTGLTKDDLKSILSSQADAFKEAIKELKKPTEMEQRQLDQEAKDFEAKQEMRKETSAGVLHQIAVKRSMQRICSHKHKNGTSHCVLIQVQNQPDYILCQKNQCKIRPGVAPAGYKGGDIYDTDAYNQLFQELSTNEVFG